MAPMNSQQREPHTNAFVYHALLAALALSTVSTARADLATCGRWKTASTCEDPEFKTQNGGINATMQLVGTVAGAMYIDFTRYTDGNCTQPLVYVHAVGTFNDLGPVSEALQASRKFALNFSLAYVMPLSDVGVDAMGFLCPCNGTDPSSPDPWAVNVTKILATCDPNNCDISFFGGTDIKFDQPAYTIVNVSDDGGFTIGLMDVDPTIGFDNQQPYLTYPTAEAECVSEGSNNLCGAFATQDDQLGEPCEILLDPWTNVVVGSKRANFTYRGPPTEDLILGQFGVYKRQVSYFSDPDCTILEATVDEQGSMGYSSRDATANLLVVVRSPASLIVKPANTARGWGTVGNLTNLCGCGGETAWFAGRMRIITQCPTGTCEKPIFNDYTNPGLNTYAYVARNTTSVGGESQSTIMFGSWNTTSTGLTSSGLKYAMTDVTAASNLQNYCNEPSFSTSLCGTYTSGCSSSPTVLDSLMEYTLSGITTNRSSEGKITYVQDLFNSTGGGCAPQDKIYDIKGVGYFSQDGFANVADVSGLVSVDIDFTSFTINALTEEATRLLNDPDVGCLCGGTWVTGQARTLYTCPSDSCSAVWTSAILPGGDFGQAGFGVAQFSTVDKILRLSTLDTNMAAGYATQFDDSVVLMNQVATCPTATHPADFAGCWAMPCYRVDAGSTSYAMTGGFDGIGTDESDVASGLFVLNRSVYASSSGCAEEATKLVAVNAEGQFSRLSASSQITGGQVTQLNILYVTVTPINSAGVAALSSECPACNTVWRVNVGTTFKNTSCDCAFLTTVAGIPIQSGNAYGVAKVWDYSSASKVDDAFRMTAFSRSASSVSSVTLTRANGEYARADGTACPYNPAPAPGPAPPGPIPGGATGGGSGGLQGGDLFLLLLFLSATVYFGGGMVFNYQRTGGMKNGGTPVIPHVTFWRGLPGLVSDGFRFVFVERFGTAGGGRGGQYSAFGGPSGGDGGYGAL